MAQFDLAEMNGSSLGLPTEGVISFFYDAAEQPWGHSPSDADAWAVQWHRPPLAPASTTEGIVLEPCSISFERGVGIPPLDSVVTDVMRFDREAGDLYMQLYEELYGEPGQGHLPGTWLGGYPYQLQEDMSEQCVEMAEAAWGLKSKASEWLLLLQLASEGCAGMNWGDGGFLYFWIRRDDLAGRRFDRVWAILQTM